MHTFFLYFYSSFGLDGPILVNLTLFYESTLGRALFLFLGRANFFLVSVSGFGSKDRMMQFFAFWNAFIDALGLLFERFFFVSHGPFVYLPPSIP